MSKIIGRKPRWQKTSIAIRPIALDDEGCKVGLGQVQRGISHAIPNRVKGMVLIDLLCIPSATEIFWNTKPREYSRKFSPAKAGPAYGNCTRKRSFII